MKIKEIFDEIAAESGDKVKMSILTKYNDNELLKKVLYLCKSKRVRFYIKQIPEYTRDSTITNDLEFVVSELSHISERHVTGGDATRFLLDLLSTLEPDDAYIIERIIDKDPKIGMGTTYINKVMVGLIEKTPYMGAVSFNEGKAKKIFDKGAKGLSQIKMDGRYCNAIVLDGKVQMESRAGEPTILTNAKFIGDLELFDDCVLNGELTMDSVPRYISNGIIASLIDILKGTENRSDEENAIKIISFEEKHGSFDDALSKIIYTVWDTITLEDYLVKKSKTPYDERLINLKQLIYGAKPSMVKLIDYKEVSTYAEAMEHFQEVLATEIDGVPMEGTILKALKGEWKDGKPTWQIKMKLEMTVDLRIVGFNYGKKGTKNEFLISSFLCESEDGLVKTRPQGLKEDMMEYVTRNQDSLLQKVLQCKCNGLSHDSDGNYSLMYPAFELIRDDKDTCDTLESIREIEDMVKNLIK